MHTLSFPKEKSKRLVVSQLWSVMVYSFPPFLFTPLSLYFIYLFCCTGSQLWAHGIFSLCCAVQNLELWRVESSSLSGD